MDIALSFQHVSQAQDASKILMNKVTQLRW
jgi:hypothetical protein